jgi:hypothetical protein
MIRITSMVSISGFGARRSWLGAALIATLCAFPAGCAGSAEITSKDPLFWSGLHVGGDEVEGYGTLEEMASAADLIVVGTFSDFKLNRIIQGDAPQDQVGMAAAIVSVDRIVKGAVPAALIVEFVLPIVGSAQEIASYAAELKAVMPQGEVVLLLRDKGGSEAGLYRLVNSLGLWTELNGELAAPLFLPADAENQPYMTELAGVTTTGALADQLSR